MFATEACRHYQGSESGSTLSRPLPRLRTWLTPRVCTWKAGRLLFAEGQETKAVHEHCRNTKIVPYETVITGCYKVCEK